MHRAFRFKLCPTAEQAEILGQWAGVTRLVFNLALEQRRDFWRQFKANEGRSISMASQSRELTALRAANDWIAAVPQTALEAALNDLDRAYTAFFKGVARYPSPRRYGVNDSCRFRGREVIVKRLNRHWGEVRLPKIGWVRCRLHRDMRGSIVTATVRRQAGTWHVAFANDVGAAPAFNSLPSVGLDRGVANTVSLSTGEHVCLPDMSKLERRRRKAQRILARRKRGSKRYAAQRQRLSRVSAKLGRARSHHLHVASANVVSRFGVVAIEDLHIKSMTASAKGTVEKPGRGVRQKAGLNRSILAQGWGLLEHMLQYKLEGAGGRLVYVPAPFTSQTCAECGVVDARSRESQAVFRCVACGHSDHADTNAARNIQRGSTAFVEVGHSLPSDEARTLAA